MYPLDSLCAQGIYSHILFILLLLEIGICIEPTKGTVQQEGSYRVALFPSFGCQSHDVLFKEVGLDFKDANVSWVQVHQYEFFAKVGPLPRNWTRFGVLETDEEGRSLVAPLSELIWNTSLPLDYDNIWNNMLGPYLFMYHLKRQHYFCSQILQSEQFNTMRQQHFDIVVVDYLLQECYTIMASLLNATTVRFSNWPAADTYILPFNIPSNPSSVPQTTTPYSCLGMSFYERTLNTFISLFFLLNRIICLYSLQWMYHQHSIPKADVNEVEAGHIFYASRTEPYFDVIRPINNRIKFFGCDKCRDPGEFRIRSPIQQCRSVLPVAITSTSTSDNGLYHYHESVCSKRRFIDMVYTPVMLTGAAQKAEMQRFQRIQLEYPDIDFEWLENHRFIMMSFGTILQVEYMTTTLLRRILQTFASFNYTVIWQTGSKRELLASRVDIPHNVIIAHWTPTKMLLAHRNLMFLITHGGVNSLNEVMLFGVPIIGLAIEGDNISNIRHKADLGIGIMVSRKDLWKDGLYSSIVYMENNIERFTKRAKVISGMIHDVKRFHANAQGYWLHWAIRNGPKIRQTGRRYFHQTYFSYAFHFALPDVTIVFVIISMTTYILTK